LIGTNLPSSTSRFRSISSIEDCLDPAREGGLEDDDEARDDGREGATASTENLSDEDCGGGGGGKGVTSTAKFSICGGDAAAAVTVNFGKDGVSASFPSSADILRHFFLKN